MSDFANNSPQLFDIQSGPDYSFEQKLNESGATPVCGVDEVGRGPLAGPVVAAAVILDPQNIPPGLQDSKKLTAARRENLRAEIMSSAIAISLSSVCSRTIDELNIRAATLNAMTATITGLSLRPGHALIDGNALPDNLPCQATALVKGDSRSVSIAAASIIAKVERDHLMARAASFYPHYGFERHKGYGTAEHLAALSRFGPCPLHRKTFSPVRIVISGQK